MGWLVGARRATAGRVAVGWATAGRVAVGWAIVGRVVVGRATVGRVVLGWAVVVVGLVAVGGCGPGPVAAPSVSATPTLPAPMASPAKPAAWSDTGEGGAAAAAVWFVRDLYAYVIETNDAKQWSALSQPDCTFCSAAADRAAVSEAAGQVGRTGVATVRVTRIEELNPLAYAVLLEFDQPTISVWTTSGESVGSSDGSRGQLLLNLHREGADWRMREGQYFSAGVPVPTTSVAP